MVGHLGDRNDVLLPRDLAPRNDVLLVPNLGKDWNDVLWVKT